jgi:hypothetical protein
VLELVLVPVLVPPPVLPLVLVPPPVLPLVLVPPPVLPLVLVPPPVLPLAPPPVPGAPPPVLDDTAWPVLPHAGVEAMAERVTSADTRAVLFMRPPGVEMTGGRKRGVSLRASREGCHRQAAAYRGRHLGSVDRS